MPLRCLDRTGRSIQAFDLSDEQWQTLAQENRKARHLRMPCCAAQVILKTSPRGTFFFAHKARGICATAPETEAHLRLKEMAVIAARAHGWTADTEVAGTTPSGAQWQADVLARKGKHKVAVEIQWSGQTDAETLRRQARYRDSGIRGLWLLRQPGFPVSHDLPAVCIGGSVESGFQALIPFDSDMSARERNRLERCHQVLPMDGFLDAAFGGRFRFGIPNDSAAALSIWGTEVMCWSCGAETMVVTRIEINSGPNSCYFTLSDLGKHPGVMPLILDSLPGNLGLGEIKFRYSKAMGERYLSNGCAHCGALLGETFVFVENTVARELHSLPISVTSNWRKIIDCHYSARWSVYPPANSQA